MKLIKSFIVAFSTYSKIPMPQFAWKDEDMQYSLCFFPWVGAVIGAVLMGFLYLAAWFNLGWLATCLVSVAIPLIITGGFHLDGYMDVSDAMHSYGNREKKLEILKDAHIGAFAVIRTIVLGCIFISAFSEINGWKSMLVFAFGFVLSRTLSGLSLVYFKAAKKEGLLFVFANAANKTIVRGVLWIEFLMTAALMLYFDVISGGISLIFAVLCFLYYDRKSKKELGGITGDMAGYFVVLCETLTAIACAIGSHI